MYRLIPLRPLRRTAGVFFDEVTRVPVIDGIDRVMHKPDGVSPGPVAGVKRPWYMHKHQDDNLMVLQGERYVEIFCPNKKKLETFLITPENVYKNDKLYCNEPAMVVWPAGIFHRIMSGPTGSISVNFATRKPGFNLKDNFDIYDLNTETGEHKIIRKGSADQCGLESFGLD